MHPSHRISYSPNLGGSPQHASAIPTTLRRYAVNDGMSAPCSGCSRLPRAPSTLCLQPVIVRFAELT